MKYSTYITSGGGKRKGDVVYLQDLQRDASHPSLPSGKENGNRIFRLTLHSTEGITVIAQQHNTAQNYETRRTEKVVEVPHVMHFLENTKQNGEIRHPRHEQCGASFGLRNLWDQRY